jgi:hypothetical protein
MCEKCEQLAKKIVRYREIVEQALDPLTTQRIWDLIGELEQRKAAMRCAK